MRHRSDCWTTLIEFTQSSLPFQYKYIVYNTITGEFNWEPSENRTFELKSKPNTIHDNEYTFTLTEIWGENSFFHVITDYRPPISSNRVAIINLGKKLLVDGSPAPLLISRTALSCRIFRELTSENNETYLIVTGGHVQKVIDTESAVMKRLALGEGIPISKIVEEDEARNTIENAVFSLDICANLRISRATVVTSCFHMQRTRMIFERVFQRSRLLNVPELCFEEDLEPAGMTQADYKGEAKVESIMIGMLDQHLAYFLDQ
eukprot:TRINITY_DN8014_c0_g1_i1.p1 TRINITY_DN8014_c0_g1~~TRINITY_DN8014_c0_g1_i1.p1  ORF type:complete len:299 (-),score=33.08 TRINITY_DN8014_c0_g1_i1:14-799(-)